MVLKGAMERFGATLRDLRIKRRMTQQELADMFGMTKQAVYQWEKGISVPDLAKLSELSRFFDISIAELTGTPNASASIDSELRTLDDATAHVLRESFLKTIQALKAPKKL